MLDGFKPSNNLGWDTMNKKEPLNTNWNATKDGICDLKESEWATLFLTLDYFF